LDPVTDVVGRGVGEGLGTVAALEDEGLPDGRGGHPVAQVVALAGEDERGVAPERRHGLVEGSTVRPARLLGCREVAGDGGCGRGGHCGGHAPRIGCVPSSPTTRPARGRREGGHPGWSSPLLIAKRVSSTRLCRWSLPRMFCTWFCTVRWEITRSAAISLAVM